MRFRTSSSVQPGARANHLNSVLPAVQAKGRPSLGSLSPGACPTSTTRLVTARPVTTGRCMRGQRAHACSAARCFSTAEAATPMGARCWRPPALARKPCARLVTMTRPAASAAKAVPAPLPARFRMGSARSRHGNRAGDKRPVGKSLELELGDLLADETLDIADIAGILGRDERERIAHGLRPAGTADAVHVVLGLFRDVVIDDVGDARD